MDWILAMFININTLPNFTHSNSCGLLYVHMAHIHVFKNLRMRSVIDNREKHYRYRDNKNDQRLSHRPMYNTCTSSAIV